MQDVPEGGSLNATFGTHVAAGRKRSAVYPSLRLITINSSA
jgi:hypothetical protein